MIDWGSLVLAPCHGVFSEQATYTRQSGESFDITVVFDEPTVGVEVGGMVATDTSPMVGIQMSEFPVGFDPKDAQGDTLIITRTGQTFTVKRGKGDGHGAARLELNGAKVWTS